MKVSGKIAIVTGASSGFGKALALQLVSRGAKVVLGDISEVAGQRLEKELNTKYSGSALFIKCDVRKKEDMQTLFDSASALYGAIDIVVNNAGIAEKEPFIDSTEDTWKAVIDIDLTAVILGTRMAIAEMIKLSNRNGSKGDRRVIVNTASLAGLYPQPQQPVYAAAKGGVVHFTKSLAHLAKDHHIHVNCVCPSFSKTAILDSSLGKTVPESMLVPIHLVIEAFFLAIEDDTLKGAVIRVTPKYGIDIVGTNHRSKM
ncbi:hypothetical protein BASA82_000794 [Batrachochytrium salamandrivorans]|uniref:Uncharacterized protein n=1 Tax=Batrachochytrium salamandrivorans TaxID=1357716 RepID=A0ABQ8FI17_9FUNG|nr:hypothetical protein BASA62_007248 [Batrachochytrium salamandrivorans]KAH6569900.1 hypothetical protein BASA60_008097 [Batrachochytrium salamandrivorans]KAH6598608.1 hypothetical protein BASA50_003646 [Batrachochytrium salamandrivorans]KAH6600785.1 hypothetical protein BASA61_002203 [Batrachochytrium salamandrivorans]KAH9257463.1 hypothetical protein BASA81_004392 [Batrachochytrium salamandrivorans]